MRWASLLALSLVFGAIAAADVTGTISGTITDQTGAVIPSAEVTVTNTGTNASFQTVSNEQGVFTLTTLPVGVYNLTATNRGFKRFEAKNIRVQVNEIARVDIPLSVGETADAVTVSGEAVHIDTTTATLKTVVDQKRIEDLPLNGRNPTQLMRLVAGVQIDTRSDVTSGTTYPGVQGVSVNGGRGNATNYVLDGAQNNDHYTNAPNPMPNPDALQEFSVQTNNFSAEFGRQGGGLVNAVTKSGTNDYHGVLFEYLRNKAVNAANFFAPITTDSSGNSKKVDDGLKRNQYGFTVGGPVLIPKLYNGKDKSFFFFSYQGQRLRRVPSSVNNIVPTAAQKRGDFSALLPGRALRDPFGGGVYPNNQIPLTQFNPITKFIADNYLPTPATGNAIAYQVTSNYDDDQVLVRGDHQLTSKNRVSGRYWYSWATQPGALDPRNFLTAVGTRTWFNRSVTLTDTHVFGTSLINSFLFGYNHTNGPVIPIYPEKSLADLGVKMYNDDKPQYHLTVNGYFGTLNTGDTNDFLRDEYQFNNTMRWSKGKHQISFGGEYNHGVGDVVNNFRANGQFGWNGSAPFTGDALADFFIGKWATLVQGIGEYKNTRFNIFALFVQDSWKVSRRLTFDVGLRWDPFFPYTDELGKLSGWRPGQQSKRYPNAPLGVLYPGDPGLPDGGFNTAWNNFGPRVGFAYDVFGNGKTSIRGGYGVFYDRVSTLSTNSAATQGPFGTVVNLTGNATNNFSDPYAGATNPFPAPLNPPADVKFVLPHSAFLYEEHMRNGNIQAWNLTVEREISGFIARVAYAGSKGTRLFSARELNPAIYHPGDTTATTNQRRILAPLGYGNMTLVEPVGNSTFHSLQFTGERRFSKGFSILANYMWSKSIDDGSANKGNGVSHTDPFNSRFDKGPSDFDHTHVFVTSGLWQLPVRFSNRISQFVLGGWNLTGINTMQSGPTFTVTSGVDNARTGTGGQRADLIGNPYFSTDRTKNDVILQYLNKAAFAPNALGTFGNLGRNRFRGPGLINIDLGLHKNFRITERVNTQFRFETFNAFNRVNLGLPSSSQSAGNFMRISSAGDPRILQFALRLSF